MSDTARPNASTNTGAVPAEPAARAEAARAETAQSFFTKAKQALNDLLEVKVVTLVANIDVIVETEGDSTRTTIASKQVSDNAIVTIFKLVDGDVTTVISEALLANAEARALHSAQVADSLEVLPRNLKLLVGIAESLLNR